jgi:hypothetical protein
LLNICARCRCDRVAHAGELRGRRRSHHGLIVLSPRSAPTKHRQALVEAGSTRRRSTACDNASNGVAGIEPRNPRLPARPESPLGLGLDQSVAPGGPVFREDLAPRVHEFATSDVASTIDFVRWLLVGLSHGTGADQGQKRASVRALTAASGVRA